MKTSEFTRDMKESAQFNFVNVATEQSRLATAPSTSASDTQQNFLYNERPQFGEQHPQRRDKHFRNHPRGDREDVEKEVPPEKWDQLYEELAILADELRADDARREAEAEPSERYLYLVDCEDTIKIHDMRRGMLRVLHSSRTEVERREIDKSNFEILKFAYSRRKEVLDVGKGFAHAWSPMEIKIMSNIDLFIKNHHQSSFRTGAFSVAIDFDKFPPNLTWRATEKIFFNGKKSRIMCLRPVVIDGVAVLNSTLNYDGFLPFSGALPKVQDMLYDSMLTLDVKAIFDVIMNFLIRGHKTEVYLPKYYENYLTKRNMSKVDDVFAFRKLIELGFIRFPEIKKVHKFKWFNVVSQIADEIGAVFVSSADYRHSKSPALTYSKPSERIITPCFLNSEDRLMVLEPIIRYKKAENKYSMISSNVILHFDNLDDDLTHLSEQLYLDNQIQLICSLCQLYPMKYLHKISIQQLLALVIRAESNFELPGMNVQSYYELYDKFARGNCADNNGNNLGSDDQ